ncbi:MAG: hypothetical protein GY757_37050, partial [bacterium]|nr:hypothetical protein [bacterium]
LILEDTHILEPRWVTEAVYKIINSKNVNRSKGVLNLRQLQEILKQKSKTNFAYPRDKYQYIIQLMRKFELCFEIDSQNVLVPDLLDVQQSTFEFDTNSALKFVIRYDFLPRSIMPRFIVRMHKDIKKNLRWRTGVVLVNNGFKAEAVVKADNEERRISLYVSGEQKRDYFAVLLHCLRDINNGFEKLGATELVPMPENPAITVSYNHLLKLEQLGELSYFPDGAAKKYNVRQLLGTVDVAVHNSLVAELHRQFRDLEAKEPRQRGFYFEAFLKRLFEVFDLQPRGGFRNTGEQIDGSIQIGNDVFLVEAKWHKNPIPRADLAVFCDKVTGNAVGTRGLFFSISGYSKEGLKAFAKGKPTPVLGFDKADLEFV